MLIKVIFLIKFVVTEASRKAILSKLVVRNYENDSFHQIRLQDIMFLYYLNYVCFVYFSKLSLSVVGWHSFSSCFLPR